VRLEGDELPLGNRHAVVIDRIAKNGFGKRDLALRQRSARHGILHIP
jgi:hypothetical protein